MRNDQCRGKSYIVSLFPRAIDEFRLRKSLKENKSNVHRLATLPGRQ